MMKFKNQSFTITIALIAMIGVTSCEKNNGYNEIVSKDMTKPDVITNIKVENFNGGANITYDLPNSPNVLYVLAKYKINDKTVRETKSSYYSDTVVVNGFAKEAEYEVELHTVSRANVKSDPVYVKVNPKTPVYRVVSPTLQLTPDFGGINIKAQNTLKKEVGIIFVAYNAQTRQMEVVDQFFTKTEHIDYSIRGYASTAKDFGVYVTDKWGNISDTLKANLTPLYEELVDKSKFSVYNLASDTPIGYNWQLPNLWNGNTEGDGWHTLEGSPRPYVATFGIGKTYKLSRFVMWERTGTFTYGHGNPKEFSIWGSNVAQPRDQVLPILAPQGTVLGDWINLGNYNFPNPPSGNPPNAFTPADEAFVKAGVSFNVPFNAPDVKFIRLAVGNTWSGGATAHVIEMSFYGRPI